MLIRLIPTTRENWKDALDLQVQVQQNHFVPSVAVSLAKVHIRPDGDEYRYLPFCIYAENSLVGFVMITVDETTTCSYWLNGFMIDANYQGKGYGKATINSVIRYIKVEFPHSECLNLTVCANNLAARELYEKFGFSETGEVYDDEIVYRFVF
ncbi:GNAT family N-acetyltransferase [Paenibacillus selenitireducens]|uniref:GNAT family N-acetyltransferase n=1 Tax=Paenibacillus selenitireducens TaxID=1324314 RepID=A0A1T2X1T2_9BACL|nr:GNAT family N-acetyltransferase [Paenibacillus selenitireducens]OPA73676.1 GNAT family N-acetyltransferase [Paenibacillus selenitireducens]